MAEQRASVRPSMIGRAHWRLTFATFALIVYSTLGLYWLATVALPWAAAGLGGEPWTFGPIDA